MPPIGGTNLLKTFKIGSVDSTITANRKPRGGILNHDKITRAKIAKINI